jgi:hypothetical protein
VTAPDNILLMELALKFAFIMLWNCAGGLNLPPAVTYLRNTPWKDCNDLYASTRLHGDRPSSNGREFGADSTIQLSVKSSGLVSACDELFDTISIPKKEISKEALYNWEQQLDQLASELRKIKDSKALLNIYESILRKSSIVVLDPLQITTFEVIANAVMDTLIGLFPKNTPITALIDEITDLHLNFIEQFRTVIDSVVSEDEYVPNSIYIFNTISLP